MGNCEENKQEKKKLEDYVRSIPDFPEEGIIFRDVTSILQDADGLKLAVDSMQALVEGTDGCDCRSRVQRIYIWSSYCV